jgi:glycosyltransferase involved in cell wall biosynthesis
MIRGETILCIAPRRWDALWKETQAIMFRLAEANRVLYFEPGRDPEHGVVDELRRNWTNLFRLTAHPARPDLYVIGSPPALPHVRQLLPSAALRYTVPLVMALNSALFARTVHRAMRALEVEKPILWLTDPYQLPLVGRFGEKLVCYFNFDEFADMLGNRRVRGLLRRLDDELTRRADVVFATSRAQCDRRRELNPRTHLVPNAVDFDAFARAASGSLPVPDDIASVPRPIVGLVGWLTDTIDFALLGRIADAYPQCSLVLIGPCAASAMGELEALRARANVVFLGRRDHASLPAYLQRFDVALMPYVSTGHVLSANPAKLHEYLAAGRAVVATALPELRPYADVLWLAESPDQFVDRVGQALAAPAPGAVEARLAVARANTWDQRVADMSHVLETLL